MAKENKYGENTKMVSFRIPESKVLEINKMIKIKLNEYERDFILSNSFVSDIEVKDATLESVVVEKKSNPADVVDKPQATFGFIHPPKKVIDIDSLKAIGNGIKPFKCGCWINAKNQLVRPKGSSCVLGKSEHNK